MRRLVTKYGESYEDYLKQLDEAKIAARHEAREHGYEGSLRDWNVAAQVRRVRLQLAALERLQHLIEEEREARKEA